MNKKILTGKIMLILIVICAVLLSAGFVYGDVPEEDAIKATDIFFKRTTMIAEYDEADPYYTIEYNLIPDNAQYTKVEWSSDDESIAEPVEDGRFRLNSTGDAVITAKLKYGATRQILLRVFDSSEVTVPEDIWADTELYNLAMGEQAQLSVSTNPTNARIDKYEYESEDDGIVTVKDGVLTAVSPGQAHVRVTATAFSDDADEGEVVNQTVVTVNVFEDKDSPIVNITQQPEDREVTYPDGAEFSIKVDHPENVKSYQWELRVYSNDNAEAFSTFTLDGTSASTDTLIVPSTEYSFHTHYFRCIVTDLRGKKHVSDEAAMTPTNATEQKPVLYVGEYALEPGDTLDLSTTDAGSGIVKYDENSFDVTFENLDINNNSVVYDSTNASSFGIFLSARDDIPVEERLEYRMHFKGLCKIINTYFDKEENEGGVCVNTYFNTGSESVKPTLIIDGDDMITVCGGRNSFYVGNGNIELNADIRTIPLGTNYCDGITANNIIIGEGVKADINACGAALIARESDIRIMNGAVININAIAPHISKGLASVSVIRSPESIYMDGAEMNISGKSVPETTVPYGSPIAMYSGLVYFNTLSLKDSKLNIELGSRNCPEKYSNNFYGISGDDFSRISLQDGSSINIDINVPKVFGATGIAVGGNILVDPGCSIKTYIKAMKKVYGISTDSKITLQDGVIDNVSEALPFEDDPALIAAGITAGEADIDLTDETGYIYSKVNAGTALNLTQYENTDDPVAFDPSYVPTMITLRNKAKISVPSEGVFSCASFDLESRLRKAETIYDLTDTSVPAKEIRIDGVTPEEQIDRPTVSQRLTLLNAIISARKVSLSKYTSATAKPFQDALKAAIRISKDADATAKEVQDATLALRESHADLALKKANRLTVKGKTAALKAASLKKKSKTIKSAKAVKVIKADGKVSYSLGSVKKAKFKKYFKVAKSGKITVKKGLKKGKYVLNIKVTAAGSADRLKGVKTVKVTVKVK